MTFDDIVDLAEKAGCDVSAIDGREYQTMWCDYYQLERFAASLIQAGAASRDAEIAELVAALKDIGDFAHDRSSGPAIEDDLWEVRRMAYELLTK